MISDPYEVARAAELPPGGAEIALLADRLCVARAAVAVRDLGLYRPGTAVPPRAAGAHHAVMRLARERGLLRGDVPAARLGAAEPYAELLLERSDVVALDPLAFRWLGRALDALPSVLAGTLLAEEALFPRNDFSLAEALYADSRVFGYFTRMAVRLIGLLGPRRVLELGAGTGETARRALAACADVERYVATDVSPVLVGKARDKLGDPRAQVARLDMDGEDWPAGELDLVLASNVLHLARDARATLSQVRARLAPGGTFVLGEVSAPDPDRSFPFVELTFGLLPSFWANGPQGPLRAPHAWQQVLGEAGFADVSFLPLALGDASYGGVFVARVTKEGRWIP